VLLKKASLDPDFCRLLLEQRAAAAREIELELTPAETGILNSVPEGQLQAMVDHTVVPDVQRRAFLGKLGAAMLAAVVAGCTPPTPVVRGIRPEDVVPTETPTPFEIEKGIRPDVEKTLQAERTRAALPEATPESTGTPDPEAALPPKPSEADGPLDSQDPPPSHMTWGIRPDRP
jgi:hypothetical protein